MSKVTVTLFNGEYVKYDEVYEDASGWVFTFEGRLQVFAGGVVKAEYTKGVVHSVYRED